MKYFLTLLCAAFALSAAAQTTQPIPTANEVGADALPPQIAPIEAPFYMPELKKPSFREVEVRLAPDGSEQMQTPRIQRAIDRLSKEGGGRVTLAKGVWKTGRIELKSNIELHIEEGAEVHYSIVMPGTVIKKGAVVKYAIVGENCVIEENARVGEQPENYPNRDEWSIAVVGHNITVSEGKSVAPKTILSESI